MRTLTREEIHGRVSEILSHTRGVDVEECTLTATLFGDLNLESIDFLEFAFLFEEEWGVVYPVDDLGEAMTHLGEHKSVDAAEQGLKGLRKHLFIDVPIDIKGLNPYEPVVLRQAATDLLTVGHLVTYIEKHLNH